jgi:uncharacterized membrane protein HdeD (DUF308 family)
MSSAPEPGPPPVPGGIDDPRPFVPWFLLLGLALIVLGAVALAHVALAGVIAVWLFGVLLLLGGTMHAVEAFLSPQWRGYLLHALAAVLDLVIGLVLVLKTRLAEDVVTLVVAVFFLAGGASRAWTAVSLRFRGWVLPALSGLATFLLGALLLADWPASGLWFIGLCVGLELVLRGCGWVGLALAVRRAAGPAF